MTSVEAPSACAPAVDDDDGPQKEGEDVVRSPAAFLRFGVDVWILFAVEFSERIAYFGVAFMLTSYVVEMLGMTTVEANYTVNLLYAVSPLSSLLASGLSDGRWGRRRTLLTFGVVYTIGTLLVGFSALPAMFRRFPDSPTVESRVFLIAGMAVFAAGFGGMKVCASPLEADTLKARHGARHLGSLFRWAYWVTNFGSLFGLIGAPLLRQLDRREKFVDASGSGSGLIAKPSGFYIGFLVCGGCMTIGILLFAVRFHRYPRNKSKASYVMFRVLIRAIVVWVQLNVLPGRSGEQSTDASRSFQRQCAPRRCGGEGFLMHAAYNKSQPGAATPCDVSVASLHTIGGHSQPSLGPEEAAQDVVISDPHDPNYNIYTPDCIRQLSATIRSCTIFLPLPFYWLIANQFSTNVILQASGTDLPAYFPADAFNNINTFTVLLGVALLDRVVFPSMAGGQPSCRVRMLVGFAFAATSMLYCGVLEVFLNQRGRFLENGSYVLAPGETELLSSWWMVPPFVLQGIASVFVDTAAMEAAYTVAAPEFKSSVFSMYLIASSASGFLGIGLAPLAVPHQMVAVFLALAGMQVVVAVAFGALKREPPMAAGHHSMAGSPLLADEGT